MIIGGARCGKRAYAAQLGYGSEQMSNRLDDAPVLYDLQALLRQSVDYEALLLALCQKQVVICNEIGCGVVPVDEAERAWREAVGRTCCALALKAEMVVRVQCGIGVVIKGG